MTRGPHEILRDLIPEGWKPLNESSRVWVEMHTILFVPNREHRTISKFSYVDDLLAFGSMYEEDAYSVNNGVAIFSSPTGHFRIDVSASTSKLNKSSYIYAMSRYQGITGKDDENASRLVSRLTAILRAHFGKNALFRELVSGSIEYDGKHHIIAGPFTLPSALSEPRLLDQDFYNAQEFLRSWRAMGDGKAKNVNECLELMSAAHRINNDRISILLRWTALEVLSGSNDVKPNLKKLYNTDDIGLFRLGVYHFEAIRNIMVHKGLDISFKMQTDLEDYLDIMCLDLMNSALGRNIAVKAASVAPVYAQAVAQIDEILRLNDPNWIKKVSSFERRASRSRSAVSKCS